MVLLREASVDGSTIIIASSALAAMRTTRATKVIAVVVGGWFLVQKFRVCRGWGLAANSTARARVLRQESMPNWAAVREEGGRGTRVRGKEREREREKTLLSRGEANNKSLLVWLEGRGGKREEGNAAAGRSGCGGKGVCVVRMAGADRPKRL